MCTTSGVYNLIRILCIIIIWIHEDRVSKVPATINYSSLIPTPNPSYHTLDGTQIDYNRRSRLSICCKFTSRISAPGQTWLDNGEKVMG
jgi:hypothetical protein